MSFVEPPHGAKKESHIDLTLDTNGVNEWIKNIAIIAIILRENVALQNNIKFPGILPRCGDLIHTFATFFEIKVIFVMTLK